jgi:hypothetical protein
VPLTFSTPPSTSDHGVNENVPVDVQNNTIEVHSLIAVLDH